MDQLQPYTKTARRRSAFVAVSVTLLSLLLLHCGTTKVSPPPVTTVSPTTPPVSEPPIGDGTADVLTYHYDSSRSGIQAKETILTPASVQSSNFGKLATLSVDGSVYAQPLIVSNVQLTDGSVRTVVVVATSQDSVYLFDATTYVPLWKVSLLASGEAPLTSADVSTADMSVIGITGTPVVDPATQTVYVVSKSKLAGSNGQTEYFVRLHALRLKDGSEALHGPVTVQASVPGSASDAVQGLVSFNPQRENQRSALLLNNGIVWLAFASHGDKLPYHGWLLGYSSSDLTQKYVLNTTPNGSEGGIWAAGNGPSADSDGNLFVVATNGTYDGGTDMSNSVMRLTTSVPGSLPVVDSFTPYNQAALSLGDLDFGIMGPVLLPDQTGALPHLLITAAKNGMIYLINRDHMGGYGATTDADVQSFNVSKRLHSNGVFFNNTLYIGGDNSPLQAFDFDPSKELFSTSAASVTAHSFGCATCYVSGTAPTVSANGTSAGIVWTLDNTTTGAAVLYALYANNLSTVLHSSDQVATDAGATAVKFTSPVVAYGRVFVGGYQAVSIYGLRSQ